MYPSLIDAWRVILNHVDIHGGQSARDNPMHVRGGQIARDDNPIHVRCGRVCVTLLLTSSNQRYRRQSLPRGPGLSPISRDVIGLASCFESIIVKCRPISVHGI